MSAFLQWLNRETGLQSLRTYANKDIYLILLTRFLRMFAYGGAALVLAVFLWVDGYGTQIGTFMTLTLLGDAAISYLLTIVADKLGRRRVLMAGSLLMVVSGTVFALTKNYYLLLLAAIVGVICPGAHEVGPFRALEVRHSVLGTQPRMKSDYISFFRRLFSPSSLPSKPELIFTLGSPLLLLSAWQLAFA